MIWPTLIHANCNTRLKSLKLILGRALFIDHNRLPSVLLRLVFSFFSLFLFFNLNFLGGAIKTDKVTIPTGEIIDSPVKLAGTSKTLALYKNALELIKMAPTGSFLKKLSERKIFEIHSLNDVARAKDKGIERFVFISTRTGIFHGIQFLSANAKHTGSVAFTKSTAFFEEFRAYKMRRGLNEERKRFIQSR